MGCAERAVLEFDEEVRAPWRPRLVPEVAVDGGAAVHPPRQHRLSRQGPSRVGAYRPPDEARPVRRPPARSASAVPGPALSSGRTRQAPRASTARPGAVRLRLTRRARRFLAVLTFSAAVALGSWLGPLVNGGEDDLLLAGVTTVVVEPGDTLWSIATSVHGDRDVRAVVDEIQELNGLESAELVPGQTLQLP
jgi:nucleoid-associated protein YgaU